NEIRVAYRRFPRLVVVHRKSADDFSRCRRDWKRPAGTIVAHHFAYETRPQNAHTASNAKALSANIKSKPEPLHYSQPKTSPFQRFQFFRNEKGHPTLRTVWLFLRSRKRLLAMGDIYRTREEATAGRFVLWSAGRR